MAQPVKKERVALNTTELGRFMKETPKAVTENDKYGKTVWCDKTTWDDGSQSLSGYNSETKSRYNLGKVFPPREQEGQATSQPAPSQVQMQDDDLPF